MKDTLLFFFIYCVMPGYGVLAFWLGCRWQLRLDAEQSLFQQPLEEWRVAVFKAQMKLEEPNA
jgi:hypothetical protein